MKASAIEFRFRMLIMTAIIIMGFWAPWIEVLGIGSRIPLLEWLALELSRLGLLRFTVAAPAVIVTGALFAAIGSFLRIWGSAWLGPATVLNTQMKAGSVMADGPYRFVRNPLYLGLCCAIVALALFMPPAGALFVLVAVPIFLLRLTLGEEAFLTGQLGEPYKSYLLAVPRFIPRLRATLLPTGRKPQWFRAVLSELAPMGVFVTLAVFSWSYDNRLMIRCIIVSFGISLIGRAFTVGIQKHSSSQE